MMIDLFCRFTYRTHLHSERVLPAPLPNSHFHSHSPTQVPEYCLVLHAKLDDGSITYYVPCLCE